MNANSTCSLNPACLLAEVSVVIPNSSVIACVLQFKRYGLLFHALILSVVAVDESNTS